MTDAVEPDVVPDLNIGEMIDRLADLKQQRTALNAAEKALGKEFASLEYALIQTLKEAGDLEGASGKNARATVVTRTTPTVTDWEVFYAHVKAEDAFYLLEKRLTAMAYRELLAAGEPPPGTEPFDKTVITISLK
jgi:ribosomal protein S4